mmetsp:Transcript_11327/g.16686  ORF Transcript_11327/g.16686 Transcript_11327/m.16686 type:complete len:212 (+) Transcript_11327:1267-1902(+)
MGISIGSKNLKYTIVDGQKSNIESSTTKIENKNIGLSSSLVHTVSNGGSGRLIDNTLNLHTGDGTSILSCLTLGIVEVSRNSHNGVLDILSKEGLSSGLHLLKNHSRNLLRGVLRGLTSLGDLHHRLGSVSNDGVGNELLVCLNRLISVVATNKTLNIKDGVLRVDGGLVLGGISDKTVTVIHKSYVGRSNTVTLVIGDNLHTSILEDTHA